MTDIYSKDLPNLLLTHADHLLMSCIDPAVIRERGYKSVLGKHALKEAGFSTAQQRAPGILIPMHGTDGKPAGWQYRPDHPRTDARDRKVKYENPVGTDVRIDVPPRCRPQLADPAVPLYITEGIKKGDSLATKGACAVALIGVWGFKGKNPYGGVTFLADFDHIALNGRQVYIVFDSDVTVKQQVQSALERLEQHLTRHKAIPHRLYLPAGADGAKCGVDDWFAQGHELAELTTLTKAPPHEPKPKREVTANYRVEGNRLSYVSFDKDGNEDTPIPLCSFNAHITEDNTKDNGVDLTRWFHIEGTDEFGRPLEPVDIRADQYEPMNWCIAQWGTRAVIASNQNAKNKLREAIMLHSQDAVRRTIYTHTGWRHIGEAPPVFLMANGAVGNETMPVDLENPNMRHYALPPPISDPLPALKASLSFLRVGELRVTLPLWASMYLAPLSEILEPAFTVFLTASSGQLKSSLTALALNHFGKGFDEFHLPIGWNATKGALEKTLFLAKDVPIVVDDWAPGTDTGRARELEDKADYIIRSQGNRQSRSRMNISLGVRDSYPPRGLLITTGEHLPSGFSNTARIFAIPMTRDDLDMVAFTAAQTQRHLYSQAMTHYILWLRDQYPSLQKELPASFLRFRQQAHEAQSHLRLPVAVACLHSGLVTALDFLSEAGAINHASARDLAREGWEILLSLAHEQSATIEDERPANRFLKLLRTLMSNGRGRFFPKDDSEPPTLSPGQIHLGWTNGTASLYLNPTAAYTAVREYSQRTDTPLTIKERAVWDDMRQMKMIEPTADGRLRKQLWVYSSRQWVIELKAEAVFGDKPPDASL